MAMSMRQPMQHPRRHGPCLEPEDRRFLERSGWRTTLEYRENHVRARDGQLLSIEPVWIAEAERYVGTVVLASAEGTTVEEAWAALLDDIEASRVRTMSRVRLLR
jgi:hypothetical protein